MGDFPEIPGCKIIEKIGDGGMATVYEGIQEKLDRRVAIKILEPYLLKDEVVKRRFENEARTAASLVHSNIVQVYDTGKSGHYYYIVMEYLGNSLKQMMKNNPEGRIPPGKTIEILGELMKALDYAHLLGIYHRDIKPDNIMFRQDETPVLVDFGIARVFDAPDQLTRSGTSLGTVYYMSPEQCLAQKDIDGRSDIYSLGVVLFEMLTGQRPYDGDSQMYIALKHIQDPIPKLLQEFSLFQPLIERMMSKDKKKRIKNRAEYLEAVESIVDGIGTNPPNPVSTQDAAISSTTQPTAIFTASARVSIPSTAEGTSHPKVPMGAMYFRVKPSGGVLHQLTKVIKSGWEKMRGFMKEKAAPVVGRGIDRVDPVMRKPLAKKLLLVILPGVVVSILVVFIIFRPGHRIQLPVESTGNHNFLLQPSLLFGELFEYQQAYALYQKGDLKSLQQALELTRRWNIIDTFPGIEKVKKDIASLLESETTFYHYFNGARDFFMEKDLKKAKEYILKAKEIKTTDAVLELEIRIDEKLALLEKK